MAFMKKNKGDGKKGGASGASDDQSTVTDTGDDESRSGKRLTGMFGRSGKKRSGGSAQSPDRRLSSVLNVSTAGGALDMLAKNTAFAVPADDGGDPVAFVILVLDVNDKDFGGLSKAMEKKNADKANVINKLSYNDIHQVISEEMMEENLLGIIPDKESMALLDEYAIMSTARYSWAVVTDDPDDASLVVFAVPSSSPEWVDREQSPGLLFNQAKRVLSGDLTLDDVVSVRLIDTMMQIFEEDRQPVITDGLDGLGGVEAAAESAMDFIIEKYSDGHYPDSEEIVDHLVTVFTGKAPDGSEVAGAHAAVESGDATGSDGETTPGVEAGTVDGGDLDRTGDGGHGVPVREMTPGGEMIDVPAPGAFSVPEGGFAQGRVELEQSTMDELISKVGEQVANQFAQAKQAEEDAARISEHDPDTTPETVNYYPTEGAVAPGVDDRDFSGVDIKAEAVRRYTNSDLGLFISGDDINASLKTPALRIEIPSYRDDAMTPWLGEQYRDQVVKANNALAQIHRENFHRLSTRFMGLLDVAFDDVVTMVSPEGSDGRFRDLYDAIKADRDFMSSNKDTVVAQRQAAVDQRYAAQRQAHIDAAADRAATEYDTRFTTRHEMERNAVVNEVQSQMDAETSTNTREMNDLRRRVAQAEFDRQASRIMEVVREEKEQADAIEQEVYQKLLEGTNEFGSVHRENDIHQATVTERKLAEDTRVEQIEKEANVRLDEMRAEHEKKYADMQHTLNQERFDRKNERGEYDAIIARLKADMDSRLVEHTSQMEALVEKNKRDNDRTVGDYEDRLSAARKEVEAAQADAKAAQDRSDRMPVNNLIMMIVIGLVCMAVGIFVAGVFFM